MKIIDWLLKQDVQINQRLHGIRGETLSARCWRLKAFQPYTFLQPAIDGLFFFAPNHCQRSYEKLWAYDATYDRDSHA